MGVARVGGNGGMWGNFQTLMSLANMRRAFRMYHLGERCEMRYWMLLLPIYLFFRTHLPFSLLFHTRRTNEQWIKYCDRAENSYILRYVCIEHAHIHMYVSNIISVNLKLCLLTIRCVLFI